VGPDGGASACLDQVIPPPLESGRAVAFDGTARTIIYRWGRQTVVTRRLVISPFELKFNRLNTNSTVSTEKLTVFIIMALKI
jgi:hypothetical protein